MINRREFLRRGTAAAAALAGAECLAQAATGGPRIQGYKRLGRTGLQVSDISFGSASSADVALVQHALARGVNYFDTAESYRWGGAEEAIGDALQGKRAQVVLSTKTKAGAADKRADMMKALDASLRRLGTDYVDIYFNHGVDEVERMRNPEWREFTDLAKRQGKIRFRGMSGHGSELVKCLDYAIDNELVDVILTSYSFAQDPTFTDRLRHTFHWAAIQPDLTRVLAKAKHKDIGVLVMKTLMGARLNDMRPFERPGGTFSQAAFRWVLSNPNVDALLISMTSKELIDEYVAASGATKVSQHDLEILAAYANMRAGNYCMPGCNACQDSCPEHAPVSEVLRTRMYDVDYGDRSFARAEYAQLPVGAAACLTCAHHACLNACPVGVPIEQFMRDAATRLG